jgi:uncharacterized membrane protein YkvA (DUF1232 family)
MPRLVRLVGGLAVDTRIPGQTRLWIGAAAVYLASPLDLLPDWIPVLGQLDDLIVAALLLDALFEKVPYEIVRSHWRGPESQLASMAKVARVIAWPVPRSIRRKVCG